MATFTWIPSYSSEQDDSLSLREAQFGDGYRQRVATGINNLVEKWNLIFDNRTTSEKDSIRNFLKANTGGQSFDWTPYGEAVAVKVMCKQWKVSASDYNLYTISCTFERVYGE